MLEFIILHYCVFRFDKRSETLRGRREVEWGDNGVVEMSLSLFFFPSRRVKYIALPSLPLSYLSCVVSHPKTLHKVRSACGT